MTDYFLRTAITFVLLACTVGPAQAATYAPATGIRIQVYGIHYGGNLVYNYKVINNSDMSFNNFTIGSVFDNDYGDEVPQLTRLPLGWTYGKTGETGTEIVLAPGGTSQPATWNSSLYGQQERSNYYLEWRASPGQGSVPNVIPPGQTLGGFSVTIPPEDKNLDLPMATGQPVFTGPDKMYIKGGFKVGPVSGDDVWGTLERLDTTPPRLSVTLSPGTIWPPNGKLVPVTAIITVKDDYDPAPEIQLVSITANEPLGKDDASGVKPGTDNRQFQLKAERKGSNLAGRIYTVTYRAIDGSGNIATASATVTVPHNMEEHEDAKKKSKKDRD